MSESDIWGGARQGFPSQPVKRQSSTVSTESDGSHYDDDEEAEVGEEEQRIAGETHSGAPPLTFPSAQPAAASSLSATSPFQSSVHDRLFADPDSITHSDDSLRTPSSDAFGVVPDAYSSASRRGSEQRTEASLADRRGSAFTSSSSDTHQRSRTDSRSRDVRAVPSSLPAQLDASEQSSSDSSKYSTTDADIKVRSVRSSRDRDMAESFAPPPTEQPSATSSNRSTLNASSPRRAFRELAEREEAAHHSALEAELTRNADTEDPHRPRTLKEARALAKERARLRKEREASSPKKATPVLPEEEAVGSTSSRFAQPSSAPSTDAPPPIEITEEELPPRSHSRSGARFSEHAILPPDSSAGGEAPSTEEPAEAVSPMDDLQRAIGAALDDVSFASAGTVRDAGTSTQTADAPTPDVPQVQQPEITKPDTPSEVHPSTDAPATPGRLTTNITAGPDQLSPAPSNHDTSSFVSANDSPDDLPAPLPSEPPPSSAKGILFPPTDMPEVRFGRRGSETTKAVIQPAGPVLVYGVNVPYPRAFMSASVADKDKRRLAPWERARAYAQLTNELSQTETRLSIWIEAVRRPSSRTPKTSTIPISSSTDANTSHAGGHRRDEPSYAASVRTVATFPIRGDGGKAKEIVHLPVNPESPPDSTPSNIPYPSLASNSNRTHSYHGRMQQSLDDSTNSIPFAQTEEEVVMTPSRRRMRSHESTSDLRARTASNVTLDAFSAAQSTFTRAASNVAGAVNSASAAARNPGNVSPSASRSGGGAFFSSLTRKSSKRAPGPASLTPSTSAASGFSAASSPRTPSSVRGNISAPVQSASSTTSATSVTSVTSATMPSPMRRSFDALNESAVVDSEPPLPPTPSSPVKTSSPLTSPSLSYPLPSPSLRPEASGKQPARSPLGPRAPGSAATGSGSADRLAPLPLPTRRGSHSSSTEPTSPATDYSNGSRSPREPGTPASPHTPGFTRSSLSYGSVRERPPPIRAGVAVQQPPLSKKALRDQEFEEALSKLADVLPDADPAVLAEYLKRANGNDLAAIGDYFLDQSTGKLLVPKKKRSGSSGSRSPGNKYR